MPRKPKNAPPPWWSAPLQEWFREVRLGLVCNGHSDYAEALKRFIHERPEGVVKLMRSFLRQDTPPTPLADTWRPPPSPARLDYFELLPPMLREESREKLREEMQEELREERRQRAIIDDLPEGRRRQICAAGGVMDVAFHAHWYPTRLERGGPRDLRHPGDSVEIGRTMVRDEVEAHVLAVAGKTLVAMQAFYGVPRLVLTGSVVKFFTGEEVSVDKQWELWQRICPR